MVERKYMIMWCDSRICVAELDSQVILGDMIRQNGITSVGCRVYITDSCHCYVLVLAWIGGEFGRITVSHFGVSTKSHRHCDFATQCQSQYTLSGVYFAGVDLYW